MTWLVNKLNDYWLNEAQITEARNIFFDKGVTKRDYVSDDISFAWLRCKYKNIDHTKLMPGLESGRRLPAKYKKAPKLDNIQFWTGLFDLKGTLQLYAGSNELSKLFTGFQPNEIHTGINGIGLAIESNELAVIIGEQHYNDVLCRFVTIGIPDPKGYFGVIFPLEFVTEEHLTPSYLKKIQLIFADHDLTNQNRVIQKCYFFNESYTVFRKCLLDYQRISNQSSVVYLLSRDPLTEDLVESLWQNADSKVDEKTVVIKIGAHESNLSQAQIESLKQPNWTLVIWGLKWRSLEFQRQLCNIIDSKLINSKSEKPLYNSDRRVIIIENAPSDFVSKESMLLSSLLMRIKPFTLEIPKLSEVGSELKQFIQRELSSFILNQYQLDISVSEETLRQLTAYNWQNGYLDLIRVGESLSEAGINLLEAGTELLPAHILRYNENHQESLLLRSKEREWILDVLKMTAYNLKQAAAYLGITRTTLYSKMALYGLDNPKKGE